MVKIFQAIDNPYTLSNEYIMTLMDGIEQLSGDVVWGWGIEKFWSAELFDYNILHVHWPNALIWNNRTAFNIKRRLEQYKHCGGKIVATCHNIQSHYCKSEEEKESFEVVYEQCDVMIHMGKMSLELMKEKYPDTTHIILPHHVYDTIYSPLDENIGKKILKVRGYSSRILCFGLFRDEEEREMVVNLMQNMKNQNSILIAPGMVELSEKIRNNYFILKFVKAYYKLVKRIVITGRGYNAVSKGLVPYYFAAADVVLIQRKSILNSGNVPMAFWMGKVVVGPNVGNVGELLTQTGNPTFNPDDELSLKSAILKGLELSKNKFGQKNREYAEKHLLTRIITPRLLQCYNSLVGI